MVRSPSTTMIERVETMRNMDDDAINARPQGEVCAAAAEGAR